MNVNDVVETKFGPMRVTRLRRIGMWVLVDLVDQDEIPHLARVRPGKSVTRATKIVDNGPA